jgi:hypothetical protein
MCVRRVAGSVHANNWSQFHLCRGFMLDNHRRKAGDTHPFFVSQICLETRYIILWCRNDNWTSSFKNVWGYCTSPGCHWREGITPLSILLEMQDRKSRITNLYPNLQNLTKKYSSGWKVSTTCGYLHRWFRCSICQRLAFISCHVGMHTSSCNRRWSCLKDSD